MLLHIISCFNGLNHKVQWRNKLWSCPANSNLDSEAIYCKTQTPDFSITWQRGGCVTQLEGVSRTQGFGVKSFPCSPGGSVEGGRLILYVFSF